MSTSAEVNQALLTLLADVESEIEKDADELPAGLLELRATVLANLEQPGNGSSSGSGGTPQVRTPSFTSTSTSGSVPAGARSVAIANIGNSAGTVMGVGLPPGGSISWDADQNSTLAAISYNASSTLFLITTVV